MHASRMDLTLLESIDDPAVLRGLIVEQVGKITAQQHEIVYKQARIDALVMQLARLRRIQFGARSEAMNAEQRELFEDTLSADIAAIERELDAAVSTSAPTASRRPRREPLPADLPRVVEVHEPSGCTCPACGAAMTKIGEDATEQLDCQPIEFFVRRHVYPKYACRPCEKLVQAPSVPAVIERGLAAPGLLAQVLVAKYVDHLPLYRQSAIYARSGVDISRATLAGWVGATGQALMPLAAALRRELLQSPVLHADETPVALLDPGNGKTKRAYLFTYRGTVAVDCQEAKLSDITVFDFHPSRSGEHIRAFLGDWRGALMCDDYGGYKALFPAVTELACFAHIRRKFFDYHHATQSANAHEVLERIGAIYHHHGIAGALDPPERLKYRQQYLQPQLIALGERLEALRAHAAGGLKACIDYALGRWPAVLRYLDNADYPLDNNAAENAIRPIALGRKNWLFVGSESAGERAAAILSLIATAKQNGHEPHAYLTDILTRLPTHPDRRIGELLPHTWQPTHPSPSTPKIIPLSA
jgi:transposase